MPTPVRLPARELQPRHWVLHLQPWLPGQELQGPLPSRALRTAVQAQVRAALLRTGSREGLPKSPVAQACAPLPSRAGGGQCWDLSPVCSRAQLLPKKEREEAKLCRGWEAG